MTLEFEIEFMVLIAAKETFKDKIRRNDINLV